MYLCVLGHDGEILLHRTMKAAPEPFLKAVVPYRDGLVVAVACIFTWYWLADLCAEEGIPFGLGHALSMKAIHGGNAKNDKIDSHKIAALLRGGMLPKASVYPARMRATRDVLRRRTHLMRKRSELLSHVQNTNAQYTLPEIGKNIAYKANRQGVAERFADASVHKTVEVDLALITSYDELLKDLELFILQTATHHDAHTLYLLQTVPGIGKLLSLVLLYEIHHIERFPSVQEFASYCRLGKCSKESGGKHLGTSGKNIGNAHLTWAFSEAATLFLRNNPRGQKLLARLEKKHDKGNALSILAHKLGRAVSFMLKRTVAFAMDRFLQTSGSRAGEPGASLDTRREEPQASVPKAFLGCVVERQGTPRPRIPEPLRLIGHPLWLLTKRR
jgi:transposase